MAGEGRIGNLVHEEEIADRQVGIELPHRLTQLSGGYRRSGGKTNHDRVPPVLELGIRHPKCRSQASAIGQISNIFDDADDANPIFIRLRVIFERDPFPDGIFAGPVVVRHALVDDDDVRRVVGISIVERSPSQERNAEGAKIIG